MKTTLLALALIVSVHTYAVSESSSIHDSHITTHNFSACDWWTNIQTNSGSAYACNIFPQRVSVPDARDVQQALNSAEQRIAALEARVGELERKLGSGQ